MDDQPPAAAPEVAASPGGRAAVLALPESRWRLAIAAALALAAGWAVYIHFATDVVPFDDAYISFRYAEHLVSGRGLVYNIGERVFGSSTPLYVLWLAALRWLLPGDLATAAVRANAIGFAAAAFLAGRLARRLTNAPWVGATVTAALLVNPMLLAISTGGMESFWFLALASVAVLVLIGERPKPWLFGLLAGLAILTRAEGVLLAPIALVVLARRPRDLLRAAAGAALPLGAWALFSTLYYGSPIPQSVIAKATPIYLLPPTFTLEQIAGNLDTWISGDRFGVFAWRRWAIAALLAVATAATVALPAARRRGAWIPAAMLFGLVAIYGIANTLYFEWYWPPVSVTLLLASVVGLTVLGTELRDRLRGLAGERAARAVRLGGAATLVVWLAALSLAPLRHYEQTAATPICYVHISPVRRRVLAYLAAGETLARVAAPTDSVAAPEFGALGATYPGRILDPCGLISREALPFLPIPREQQARVGAGAISVDFVQATSPDWIVALPIFTSASLRTSEWFNQHYRVEGTMPLPFVIWESEVLVIYRKRE
jgi:hypothetical protein